MSIFALMHGTVRWRPSLGEGDFPGGAAHGPEVEISPARVVEKVKQVSGDRVANGVVWVPAEHGVAVDDLLDGATVVEVSSIKDAAGAALVRVCYVQR